jgi:hypothetical protein
MDASIVTEIVDQTEVCGMCDAARIAQGSGTGMGK